jgi:PAS domain S-box-containing protein
MTGDLGGTPAEELLRAAMDAMVDPQALLEAVRDRDGRVIDFVFREVNSAVGAILGMDREDLLGAGLTGTVPAIVESGLFAQYVHCLETGEPLRVEDFPFTSRRRPGLRRFDVQAAASTRDWLSSIWRDVTERYEAKQEVASSEEHFRLLAENASDMVVQLRDLEIAWISPSVEAAMGAPPSYWIGRQAVSLLAPQDLPVFYTILAGTEGGATSVGRIRAFDTHGALHWLEVHAKLHHGTAGEPDGHIAALRLIDDEVAAETAAATARQEQAESDARFRRLIENSAIATNLLTPHGRFLVVNQAMCDLVGYDADTLANMTWRDLATPEDVLPTARAVSDILMGRKDSYRITRQYVHADGHRVWGELTISCIRDPAGNVENLIAQIIDITEQVELRAKQAEADARFRRLMETSNVSMALVTPDGRLDVVNEALCELLGYDEQTLRTKTWQELTPQHYLEDDRTAIEDLLAGSIDTYRVNKQYIHAGGHLVWVDLSVSCLRDAAGEVQYLVAQGVDISEEIAAQERLARSEMENRLLADRLQSEMLSAAGYVESILPRDLPGPVEVSSRYLPALDLGGDCFHYRWLDDDHLEVYLIDVSGHGIRPAFLSVSVHNLIRSGSLPPSILLNPDRVLEAVNNLFPMEDQADSYLTMWCGIYQPSTRTLRYASAGHPPALALDRDSDGVTAAGLSTVGCPIGMFPDSVYTCESYAVPRGGQLLLYSDGAFDLSLDGRPLTREEFVGLCTELAAQPDWSLDDLVGRLRALSPTGDFDDDCALVLLTFP